SEESAALMQRYAANLEANISDTETLSDETVEIAEAVESIEQSQAEAAEAMADAAALVSEIRNNDDVVIEETEAGTVDVRISSESDETEIKEVAVEVSAPETENSTRDDRLVINHGEPTVIVETTSPQ
ncbi:MAG: hypothetical protein AAGA69_09900, partial [Pseudomonadota bacterium]